MTVCGSSSILKSASTGLLLPANILSNDSNAKRRLQLSASGLTVDTNKNPQHCNLENAALLTRSTKRASTMPHPSSSEKEPLHRVLFDLNAEAPMSPLLRSPPRNRRGSIKLLFDDDLEDANKTSDQERFVNIVQRLESLVSQAAVRLNDMIALIRGRMRNDAHWIGSMVDHRAQLSEVSYQILTANYYLAKWHHQLDPAKCRAPHRPRKAEDMPENDIIAEAQGSIARMEILTSKLAPVLHQIIKDARNTRRRADDPPLTPTSKDPVELAAKRGFKDADQISHLVEHLEHLLAETHRLAHPPTSGLENCQDCVRNASSVVIFANRFRAGARKSRMVELKA